MTHDAARGWNRVAYCPLVGNAAKTPATTADTDPAASRRPARSAPASPGR
jgi:hypothetical protein